MRLPRRVLSLVVSSLFLAAICLSQQTSSLSVPNLIRYGGTLKDAQGAAVSSATTGVTFAIYRQQDGGAAVWMETQNVTTDPAGNYNVLLGSTTATGLPADLFSQEEQRWLGVQVQGQAEQPRVLLVSVPYAFKAHEADTLGGKSVSDFVLAAGTNYSVSGGNTTQIGPATANNSSAANPRSKTGAASQGPTNFSGSTTNQIVGVTQTGTGAGVNATAPNNAMLATATGSGGYAVYGIANGSGGIAVKGDSTSASGTGVRGIETATTGSTTGVSAYVNSTAGTAGVFNNAAGGKILSGQSAGVEKFAVDGSGNITAHGAINAPSMLSTTSAATGVGVTGNATNTTGANTGVLGETASINGVGVNGMANATAGQNIGVYGQSNSSAGWGVYGSSQATTGEAIGVEGLANSSGQFSAGVLGYQNSATGLVFGVNGQTNSTTNGAAGVNGYEGAASGQVHGVSGNTNSTSNNASGVNGFEGATSGQVYGVNGQTNSITSNAAGVNGFEGAIIGVVYGVLGNANSPTQGAAGVNGFEGSLNGVVSGVSGSTNSTTDQAAGILAYEGGASGNTRGLTASVVSPGGYAVYGDASASFGSTVGVFGDNHSTARVGVLGKAQAAGGIAGQFVNTAGSGMILQGESGSGFQQVFYVDAGGNGSFSGNLNVTGTLTKGGGSFKIDDPLDPENKYLSHSFVESPDMMNLYNGSARLDARGEAWVTMPQYFQALNRDFQYVLTSVGSSQPRLYIAREIKGNRFKIAGGRPNGKVSWMVTGIRQDAWANAHRIPVEEEKPEKERGTYLYPGLYPPASDKNTDALLHH